MNSNKEKERILEMGREGKISSRRNKPGYPFLPLQKHALRWPKGGAKGDFLSE